MITLDARMRALITMLAAELDVADWPSAINPTELAMRLALKKNVEATLRIIAALRVEIRESAQSDTTSTTAAAAVTRRAHLVLINDLEEKAKRLRGDVETTTPG